MSETEKKIQVAGLTGDALEQALTHAYNEQDDWTGDEDERPETAPKSPICQMVAKHTPGPWTIDHHDELNMGGRAIGLTPSDVSAADMDYPEAKANLVLIADAPSLLEALAWALDQIEDDLDPDHQEALVAARSLVAKHQGRG